VDSASDDEPLPATGPLAGVRVLDLSSVIMGPLATQMLGDLGAEVVSVEAPNGDINRLMDAGPHPGLSGVTLNLLRNKRNISLDVKDPRGREALLRIAATCDVFVTNLRPGSLTRLGLTFDDVRAVRPDVVYCQAQGYPSDGPDADRPAYDDVIQAVSGLADSFALSSGTPRFAPTILADKVSALTIVYAVCAALFRRHRTGTAERIEVPMVDVMRSFMLVEHGSGAIPSPATGPVGYSRVLAENRRPFAAQDGWICVLPYSPGEWKAVLEIDGRGDVVASGMTESRQAIIEHANELYAVLAEVIATRSTSFWTAFCEEHGIPAGLVVPLDQITAELPEVDHPLSGAYHHIPDPVRFSGGSGGLRRPAPVRGQHTEEVLAEAGLTEVEIAELERSGVAVSVARRAR